jgi:thymidylate synthase (FAD)
MSPAVESTRYCNYSKNKFNSTITYIQPWWICDYDASYFILKLQNNNFGNLGAMDPDNFLYLSLLKKVEDSYIELIKQGFKAQEARGILPLDTKCDMIMTGFVSDWKHFFNLRALGTTGAPHPQAKELAEPLMKDFKTLNYI